MAKVLQQLTFNIRFMQDIDIPQAMEIDREAFPTQWPHPSYTSFKQELRNKLAHYIVASKAIQVEDQFTAVHTKSESNFWIKFRNIFLPQVHTTVLAPPSREYIVGIAGFWLMMREAHITTIAVRDSLRRLGIGEQLLISIIDLSFRLNAQIITLEVRVSNDYAQLLYQKYGFYKTGTRQHYYTDNGEDAYIMSTDAITSDEFQSNFQILKKTYEQKWQHVINKEVHNE